MAAALREAYEEIGLVPELVEFAGYLPDHVVISGFRVTPCVGFVSPEHQLQIAAAEVHDVFEVPLDFILDPANHKSRHRTMGDYSVEIRDIPYGDRNIWGATAGMLMTFRRMLQGASGRAVSAPIEELRAIMARLRVPTAARGIARKPSPASPPTPSRRRTRWRTPSSAATWQHLKDELGDLLFQVVFHAQMAEELRQFDFEEVAGAICDKLRRRHPHVFGERSLS